MKSKIKSFGFLTRLSLVTVMFLLGSIVALGQGTTASNLTGTYEGVMKRPGVPEQKVSLELKSEDGKITGRATHGSRSAEVTDGKLENGTLTLTFGKEGTFVAKVDGDKLVGEAVHGTERSPIELTKITPAVAAAPAAPAASAAAAAPATPFSLDGQWEAVADANGQPFPFLLTLKADGENVTGSSSSQLGDSTIKTGSWKAGKLALEMEGANGVVTLNATVVEGKLSGEFDYAGQLQGKWVAVKKN